MKKEYIKENGRVTPCPSNISKMNIFEYMWLYIEMYSIFGKFRKPNIFWFVLFLICPWLDNICYTLSRYGIFELTIGDFLILLFLLFLTFCGLGPICTIIIACNEIKKAKKFCEKVNRKKS